MAQLEVEVGGELVQTIPGGHKAAIFGVEDVASLECSVSERLSQRTREREEQKVRVTRCGVVFI